MLFQRKYNRNNHITAFAFLFEQAFTISKIAIGIGKLDKGFRIQIKAAYAMDNIFDFNAVCADVLYRRRADRTRNQAEVFQPAQTQSNRMQNKIMPNFPGLRFDINQAV